MGLKILYNVTVKIDLDVNDEWLSWMKETHIPDVMMTGKFDAWKLTKILGDDDPHGVTYAVQYTAPDMDTFLEYSQYHAPKLQAEHRDKFAGKFGAFRTLMEVVDEYNK